MKNQCGLRAKLLKASFGAFTALAVAAAGCASSSSATPAKKKPVEAGTTSAPPQKTPTAKKPPTTKPSAPKMVTASGGASDAGGDAACTQGDVGKCGCLPEERWVNIDDVVYDIVCCEMVGDAFTLYSCGDDALCDDSGDTIACKPL